MTTKRRGGWCERMTRGKEVVQWNEGVEKEIFFFFESEVS
jgi:hypothetical protein